MKKPQTIRQLKLDHWKKLTEKRSIEFDVSKEKDGWNIPITARGEPQFYINTITDLIEQNHNEFGAWGSTFETVLDIILYTLTWEEEKYMNAIKPLNRTAINTAAQIFSLLLDAFCNRYLIYDYLGSVYMKIAYRSKSKFFGQYFTPFQIALTMSHILIPELPEAIKEAKFKGELITLHEPAIGSGVMFLALKRRIVETIGLSGLDYFSFTGQDIDRVCVKMAKVQLIFTDYRYMTNYLYVRAIETKDRIRNLKQNKQPKKKQVKIQNA